MYQITQDILHAQAESGGYRKGINSGKTTTRTTTTTRPAI
jgi:hypothetical protein